MGPLYPSLYHRPYPRFRYAIPAQGSRSIGRRLVFGLKLVMAIVRHVELGEDSPRGPNWAAQQVEHFLRD